MHASLIHSFVGKFTDSSVLVRTAMVRHGVELLRQLPPVHAVPIAKALQSRFYDPDENVRTEMVERVCEACKESIGPFAPLLGEVGGRMQDKKTGVKATARANLCALYRQHLSSASLQWVPQKLLQSYGENDGAKNHEGCREIEALVHSTLLPQESEPRLRALCAVHAALLPRHRKVLRLKLLHGKREAQQYVGWWLELQAKLKADPKDKQLKAKTAELVLRMSRPMAEPAKAKEVWEQLGACKDKNVTKHIGALCSASSDYDEVRKADAELRKCMAQRLKSDQKELLSTMMARSSMWLIWRSGATKLLREVTEELRGGGVSGDDELPVRRDPILPRSRPSTSTKCALGALSSISNRPPPISLFADTLVAARRGLRLPSGDRGRAVGGGDAVGGAELQRQPRCAAAAAQARARCQHEAQGCASQDAIRARRAALHAGVL